MTNEEWTAICQRHALRLASAVNVGWCVSKYDGGTCEFGEYWICATHRDPDETEEDVSALIAEVKRLRAIKEALDALEARHGDDSTCSAAGECSIGGVIKIIRSRAAEGAQTFAPKGSQ